MRHAWLLSILLICVGTARADSLTSAPATKTDFHADGRHHPQRRDRRLQQIGVDRKFRQGPHCRGEAGDPQDRTYGGLVTAGGYFRGFLKQQSDLHITAFIDQKAISAGAMIAMACDEIVMQPHATTWRLRADCLTTTGLARFDGRGRACESGKSDLSDFSGQRLAQSSRSLLAPCDGSVGTEVHWMQDAQGNRKFADGPNAR